MMEELFWSIQEMTGAQWFLMILGTALLVLAIVASVLSARGTNVSQQKKGAHPTSSEHLKAAGDFSFHSGQPFKGGGIERIEDHRKRA